MRKYVNVSSFFFDNFVVMVVVVVVVTIGRAYCVCAQVEQVCKAARHSLLAGREKRLHEV